MIKKKTDDKKQWFLYPANLRTKTLVIIALSALIIVSIFVSGYFIRDIPTSFISANQMPSFAHPFGTDWMGRDMFQRTVAGLGLRIMVGFIAAVVSTFISIILGLFSSFNKFADESVAANKNKELDEKVFGNIIKEEIERINAKRGNNTN
jgi:peptide/nickel transport system permease protein